jgi:hypothetical protein
VLNSAAMAAEISSEPATTKPVVGNAAAVLASLIVEPILARSVAAEDMRSGAKVRNDIVTTPVTATPVVSRSQR